MLLDAQLFTRDKITHQDPPSHTPGLPLISHVLPSPPLTPCQPRSMHRAGSAASAPPFPAGPGGFASACDPRVASGGLFPTHWTTAAAGGGGGAEGQQQAWGSAAWGGGGDISAMSALLSAAPGPRPTRTADDVTGQSGRAGSGQAGADAGQEASALYDPGIALMVRLLRV